MFPAKVLLLLCLVFPLGWTQWCGLWRAEPNSTLNRRRLFIAGGNEATDGSYSVASIQTFKSDVPWRAPSWKHICGGTLITSRWVLTSAHCIDEVQRWGAIRLVVGDAYLSSYAANAFEARSIIQHPQWRKQDSADTSGGWNMLFDIGLIELDRNVSVSKTLFPSCLNKDFAASLTDDRCIAAGWGGVSENAQSSDFLNYVQLDKLSFEQCVRAYRSLSEDVPINSYYHFCAGRPSLTKGICTGDAGGPLFCKTRNNRVELVGVGSFSTSCGNPRFPGVFIKVSNHLSWIAETTGDGSILSDDESKVNFQVRDAWWQRLEKQVITI